MDVHVRCAETGKCGIVTVHENTTCLEFHTKAAAAVDVSRGLVKVEVCGTLIPHGDGTTRISDVCAAAIGDEAVVTMGEEVRAQQELIRRGATGHEKLLEAVEEGNTELLELYVAAGYSMTGTDSHGRSPLSTAVLLNNVEMVRFLAEKGGVNVNSTMYGVSRSVLHLAAGLGFHAMVVELLALGADVRKSDREGWTALHRAAHNGHVDVVRLLLPLTPDAVDVPRSSDGRRPLYGPVVANKPAAVRLLLQSGARPDYLLPAAERGYLAVVQGLLSAGAPFSSSHLCAAARNGHLPVVQALLSHGAVATPEIVSAAKQGEHAAIAELLQQHCTAEDKTKPNATEDA